MQEWIAWMGHIYGSIERRRETYGFLSPLGKKMSDFLGVIRDKMNRAQAISDLADRIARIHLNHPVRVGIDVIDASGKTTLAEELVEPLQVRDRRVIRVSINDQSNHLGYGRRALP